MHDSLKSAILDLERGGHLRRVTEEVDPNLEMAAVHRRVFRSGGPALLFERVGGSPFPAASNLFGTLERARYLLRDSLDATAALIRARAHPPEVLRNPRQLLGLPFTALHALPKRVRRAPLLFGRTSVSQLPAVRSWPRDGGPFITLPQVCTQDPDRPGILSTNLGMYRVQLSGNRYEPDRQVGLHYQIHRGIGVHHAAAIARGERLRVSIFVGGPPAHTFAAVMPLPEGLPEVAFAGVLARRRFRYLVRGGHILSADADFCIVGTLSADLLPEGPFGDHLGYYSLQHDFPVLDVEEVYHRKDAIWPFTVVGRPPQEDSVFGSLIHELTGPMVPASLPGLRAMHAVDVAGVHPLLFAIGSERYVPYQERRPQELLTIANAILGFGQASLAKYLFLLAGEDAPGLDIHDEAAVLAHILERVDYQRDLHFQTRTTIDTLDYSGSALNEGSKLVVVAAGPPRRRLATEGFTPPLPEGFHGAEIPVPGIAVVQGPPFRDEVSAEAERQKLVDALRNGPLGSARGEEVALWVVVDDLMFACATLPNFLWVTFTRSNPSHDVFGVDSFVEHKHWGCRGALCIDARSKPHHAWPLEEDPTVERHIDRLFARGGSLFGVE